MKTNLFSTILRIANDFDQNNFDFKRQRKFNETIENYVQHDSHCIYQNQFDKNVSKLNYIFHDFNDHFCVTFDVKINFDEMNRK